MKVTGSLIFNLLIISACSLVFSQDRKLPETLPKILIDDDSKFTNIGNIGLTVTNYGRLGDGFVEQRPINQPSCEYPIGSGIEHVFSGGLWVGGMRADGKVLVTTGAVDISYLRDVAAGFEFTTTADPNDRTVERSSLSDSPFFHPEAISHQDFICNYSDSNIFIPELLNTRIPEHSPINISVHQESYAWNYPFADDFVILNYKIKNTGREILKNVYIGLWADLVVRNTNITTSQIGSPFYQHVGNGFTDSLKLAYAYDFDGDPGFTDPGLYVGLKLLGATAQANDTSYQGDVGYNAWLFRNNADPNFFSPLDDLARYEKMRVPLSSNLLKQLKGHAGNYMTLISTGKFSFIEPDSTLNVVLGVICGPKNGNEPTTDDTENSKRLFYTNARWAQIAYNGEDRNGNGRLDPSEDLNNNEKLDSGEDTNQNGLLDFGEDVNGDGILNRYVLPSPPKSPRVKVVSETQQITLYWDNRSENSRDLITGDKDFEGYRIYRTLPGEDLPGRNLLGSLTKIAEFDSIDGIGYDTGFDFIRLKQPLFFEDEIQINTQTGKNDTIFYHYRFINRNLLDGWQYAYSITAFDRGNPANGLESLESGLLGNVLRVFPGTPASDAPERAKTSTEVGVYPNPYRAGASWDGLLERERKINFYNLPAEAEIRIYTLNGDLVDSFIHDGNYSGENIQWYEKFTRGKPQFAGGEHAWDLVTKDDQAIATGLYLFTVKNLKSGEIQRGKFLVIK